MPGAGDHPPKTWPIPRGVACEQYINHDKFAGGGTCLLQRLFLLWTEQGRIQAAVIGLVGCNYV